MTNNNTHEPTDEQLVDSELEAEEELKQEKATEHAEQQLDKLNARLAKGNAELEKQRAAEATEEERQEYMATFNKGYLQEFVDGISDSVDTPTISTGFKDLDYFLDGGLYEGLYTIGAISSLGKTSLILQIADQIAEQGHDVLIFSLEMARFELMAKSISRHTLQTVLQSGGDIRNAKTARGITAGKRYKNYSNTEKDIIDQAILDYEKYANHIRIVEGMGDVGVVCSPHKDTEMTMTVRDEVERHKKLTGVAPVVVVDYMQILAPYNPRGTDKQNTDKAVIELKRLSRDYKIPVLAISSFNRQGYKEAVTMESFKESGAIEYTSDILFGLQLKGAGTKAFNVDKAKRQNPREIELVILKQRQGVTGTRIEYNYYPAFNYFKEIGEIPFDAELEDK